MTLMGYKGMVWFSVRVTSTSWPSVAASVAMITRAVECPTSVVTSSPSISQPISSLRLECLRLTTERATEHAWKLNRTILWNILATKAWLLILRRNQESRKKIVNCVLFLLNNNGYREKQKTVNTWKISGMLILWSAITCSGHVSKPQNHKLLNYRCCLRFNWLFFWVLVTQYITFHNISGVHGFVSFTVKHTTFYHSHKNNVKGFCLVLILSFCQAFKNVLLLEKLSVSRVKLITWWKAARETLCFHLRMFPKDSRKEHLRSEW